MYGDRHYVLTLTPDEILNCLLMLPPACLFHALAHSDSRVKTWLLDNIPEVLKRLAMGTIARYKKD
jgi:hypothetical protein